MYRNIYKYNQVSFQNSEMRMIDNNELLQEKLSGLIRAASMDTPEVNYSDGFVEGLEAPEVDALFLEEGTETSSEEEARLQELYAEIEEATAKLQDLRLQADSMIEDAKSEIGAMQMKAYEEAKEQGMLEGERLGRLESDEEKRSYQKRKAELEALYDQKFNEMEPALVQTITDIYEHIFHVDLKDYQGLVTGLILNTLQNSDGERNFLIHVATADYDQVMEQKDQILAMVAGAKVEIISDMILAQGQCSIETENGVYDCSLDTELKELSRKLQLISYKQ